GLVSANGVVFEPTSPDGMIRPYNSTGSIIVRQMSGQDQESLIVQSGMAGQTADLLQLQNNTGNTMAAFTASGRLLYRTGSGHTVTISTAALSGSAVLSFPNTNGVNDTICLQLLGNCGGGVGGGTGD